MGQNCKDGFNICSLRAAQTGGCRRTRFLTQVTSVLHPARGAQRSTGQQLAHAMSAGAHDHGGTRSPSPPVSTKSRWLSRRAGKGPGPPSPQPSSTCLPPTCTLKEDPGKKRRWQDFVQERCPGRATVADDAVG